MTNAEEQTFRILDRRMAADPASLQPEELHVYRILLAKQVSEIILTMARKLPEGPEAAFFDLCVPQGSELRPLQQTLSARRLQPHP